jgi:colicin import membrane protein
MIMHERASNAFLLSLTLHAGVVLAIAALAFAVQQSRPPPMQIFELVAGPPTDPMATEAPALGTPDGQVEVKIPEPPARSEPAPSEPAPTQPELSRPAVRPETKPPRPETKTTAIGKTPAKPESQLSYDQYVKKFGKPTPSKSGSSGTPRATAVPQIHGKGIAGGLLGGSPNSRGGQGGTALTAAQHSALEAYMARLVTALRQNHEKPPGLSDLLNADVEFLIAPDGSISHVHIVRSSGNAAFDLSCIETFQRVGSVGPKPDGRSDTWTTTFRMKDE